MVRIIKSSKYITMSKIKTGLTRLKATALSSKAQNLVENMTGNANFPTPSPDLAVIEAKRVELNEWIVKSSFGDKRAIEMRKTVYAQLQELLRQLAGYVVSIAAGDGNVILSSGFEIRKAQTAVPPVSRPVDFRISRTAYEGKVIIDWASVTGSQMYVLEMTTDNPESGASQWSTVAMTTKSRHEVENLVFGQYYYFRVKAVGVRNESPYSEVALIRAA